MDGVTLLTQARAAGLEVAAKDSHLVIRGPRSADAIARALLTHKAELVPILEAEAELQHLTDRVLNLDHCADLNEWYGVPDWAAKQRAEARAIAEGPGITALNKWLALTDENAEEVAPCSTP